MSWFRLDDKFHAHPKVLAAGNAAVGLWVRCATWSAAHHTDGAVPAAIARLYGKPREIQAVTDADLWERSDDGYLIADFLDYNPSAEESAERSAKRAEAGRVGGKRSGQVRSKPEASASLLLRTQSNPDPTRPDPLKKSSSVSTVSEPGESLDPRIAEAIERFADHIAADMSPRSMAGYRRAIITNGVDHHPRLIAALSANPAATAVELAHLLGVPKPKLIALEACEDDPECNAGWRLDEAANVCRPCALCPAGLDIARREQRLETLDNDGRPNLRAVQ